MKKQYIFDVLHRTHALIVLPCALLAFPILFGIGYYWSNDIVDPIDPLNFGKLYGGYYRVDGTTVDPIVPIEITNEKYYLILLAIAVLFVLYWAYTQRKNKFGEISPLKVGLTLLIYGLGLFIILGLDTVAFRLGTIVRTAHAVEKEDLELLESIDAFPYGFMPKDIIEITEDIDFSDEEAAFRQVRRREDTILAHRYDFSYQLSKTIKDCQLYSAIPGSYHDYRSSLPYQSYPLPLPYYSSEKFNLPDYQASKYYLLYRDEYPFKFYLSSHYSRQQEKLVKYRMLFSGQSLYGYTRIKMSGSDIWPLSNVLDELIESDLYDLRLTSAYDNYYLQKYVDYYKENSVPDRFYMRFGSMYGVSVSGDKYIKEYIDRIQYKVERIVADTDSVENKIREVKDKLTGLKSKVPELTFFYPSRFYETEELVRAVRHAQQYLEQKIIYRYFGMVLSFLPFVVLLFFMLPFLSARNLMSGLLVVVLFLALGAYFYGDVQQIQYDFDVLGKTGNIAYKVSESDLPYGMHKEKFMSYVAMTLALLGLLMTLIIVLFNNKKKRLIISFLNLFMVAAIAMAVLPLFIKNVNEFTERLLPYYLLPYFNEDFIYYPKMWGFYLVAVLCLVVPILFSYLKELPESETVTPKRNDNLQ